MSRIRKVIAISVVAVGALVAACAASTHAPARAAAAQAPQLVYVCQQTPCTNTQELEVFDGYGNPIFSVGEYGDVGAFGTGYAVFAPGTVTKPVVTINDNGTVTVRGQVLTAADIATLHRLERAHVTLADLRWLARQAR